jgi:hypothetical protein
MWPYYGLPISYQIATSVIGLILEVGPRSAANPRTPIHRGGALTPDLFWGVAPSSSARPCLVFVDKANKKARRKTGLLRQRLLSDHKRPIDFPTSPKVQGNTTVAMLAARCCGKPCDCRPEHERRADHESHNNSAASCFCYSVPRLVHYLRDTGVRICRSKPRSRLH